jgi:predicted SAM-dependent methyltransferase
MNKLNLGSGNDYKDGYINVDIGQCKKDLEHDLEIFPYPFDNNQFDEILMQHCIEHISRENFPKLVAELHRISIPGGKIYISAPYYLSRNAFTDFTHKNFMTEESFGYFDPTHQLRKLGKIYGLDQEFNVRYQLDRDRHHPECNISYILETIKQL